MKGTGTVLHILQFVISPCYSMRVWITWHPGQKEVRLKDGRMDGWTDSSCVLQDFVPFKAAALLPLNLNHTLKQGTGTADNLLPLGCYYRISFILSILGGPSAAAKSNSRGRPRKWDLAHFSNQRLFHKTIHSRRPVYSFQFEFCLSMRALSHWFLLGF